MQPQIRNQVKNQVLKAAVNHQVLKAAVKNQVLKAAAKNLANRNRAHKGAVNLDPGTVESQVLLSPVRDQAKIQVPVWIQVPQVQIRTPQNRGEEVERFFRQFLSCTK
jgi:hypothetical protein